ncbi:MAG: 3-deoxy-manno-octulosonate cytidylyltransferase [Sphingomonas bacterium]|nr:3-deoxy-manno-octulosonate cytidylyltransferase [Sphingomonas bacterium]
MPKTVILIPARFASTRYRGKPLVDLKGAAGASKSLIQRSYEAACRVPGVAAVHVVTDDDRIAAAVRGFGGSALMTSEDCRNGTERCAEALDRLDADFDVVVNFQGDALLTPPGFVTALVNQLDISPDSMVATPALRQRSDEVRKLQAEEASGRVGGTSVVVNTEGRALYFSKKLIPYLPDNSLDHELAPVRLHIGVYAYRRAALATYVATPPSELEMLEGLEQLRFLVAGVPIDVVEVATPSFSLRELNNPEDVSPIEDALAMAGLE